MHYLDLATVMAMPYPEFIRYIRSIGMTEYEFEARYVQVLQTMPLKYIIVAPKRVQNLVAVETDENCPEFIANDYLEDEIRRLELEVERLEDAAEYCKRCESHLQRERLDAIKKFVGSDIDEDDDEDEDDPTFEAALDALGIVKESEIRPGRMFYFKTYESAEDNTPEADTVEIEVA